MRGAKLIKPFRLKLHFLTYGPHIILLNNAPKRKDDGVLETNMDIPLVRPKLGFASWFPSHRF